MVVLNIIPYLCCVIRTGRKQAGGILHAALYKKLKKTLKKLSTFLWITLFGVSMSGSYIATTNPVGIAYGSKSIASVRPLAFNSFST